MSDIDNNAPENRLDERDNLTRLLNLGRRKIPRISRRYSVVVYSLRFVLPVIALAIVTIVLAWPKMDDNFSAIPKKDIIPQNTGRNELINPHFEGATAEQNPYVITAERAVQDLNDQSIVLLEKPVADVTMQSGRTLNMKAINGVYRQDAKILVLDGTVTLQNELGDTVVSDKMNVSVDDKIMWTDTAVHGDGPSGTLDAQAMNANNATGIVIFTGPAKLIFNPSAQEKKP